MYARLRLHKIDDENLFKNARNPLAKDEESFQHRSSSSNAFSSLNLRRLKLDQEASSRKGDEQRRRPPQSARSRKRRNQQADPLKDDMARRRSHSSSSSISSGITRPQQQRKRDEEEDTNKWHQEHRLRSTSLSSLASAAAGNMGGPILPSPTSADYLRNRTRHSALLSVVMNPARNTSDFELSQVSLFVLPSASLLKETQFY